MNAEARALMAKINKAQGADVVVLASDLLTTRRITSGSLSLDIALGGGWPSNHWIEVRGRESHGKTAVVLKTIAANQEIDPDFTTLWIAAEHYDVDQATALGVDNDRMIVVNTQQMEFAFTTMLQFAESRSVDCIVLDSYPALIPDDEAAKDMDELTVAIGARLLGKFFRKAGPATKRSMSDENDRPIVGFIINQFRDQIGGFSPHGVPQTTPGGKAKNYAFYVQVDVARAEYIEEARPGKGKVKVGQTIKITTVKNKSAPPRQVATVDFYFRDAPFLGFLRGDYDEVKEIVTLGVLFDVITRRGAYFEFDGNRWQGKESMLQAFREDLDLRELARRRILAAAVKPDAPVLEEEAVDTAASAGVRTIRRISGSSDQEVTAAGGPASEGRGGQPQRDERGGLDQEERRA